MSLLTPQKIQELSASLHLEELPEEEQAEFLADIGELLFEGAMMRAFAILSEEETKTLKSLFEASGENPEDEEKSTAISLFLQKYVPDFNAYLAEEAKLLLETWAMQMEEQKE